MSLSIDISILQSTKPLSRLKAPGKFLQQKYISLHLKNHIITSFLVLLRSPQQYFHFSLMPLIPLPSHHLEIIPYPPHWKDHEYLGMNLRVALSGATSLNVHFQKAKTPKCYGKNHNLPTGVVSGLGNSPPLLSPHTKWCKGRGWVGMVQQKEPRFSKPVNLNLNDDHKLSNGEHLRESLNLSQFSCW